MPEFPTLPIKVEVFISFDNESLRSDFEQMLSTIFSEISENVVVHRIDPIHLQSHKENHPTRNLYKVDIVCLQKYLKFVQDAVFYIHGFVRPTGRVFAHVLPIKSTIL